MGLRIHHMPFYGQEETSWARPWIRPDNDLRVGSLEWANWGISWIFQAVMWAEIAVKIIE